MRAIEIDQDYILYSNGVIFSIRNNTFLKRSISSAGYYTYGSKFGTSHGLLAQYFLNGGKPLEKGMVVNHKDGIKLNNDLDNLEIVTHSQNVKHSFRMGLQKPAIGESNGQSKVTRKDIYRMYDMFKKGMCNETVAKEFGLHDRYISLVRHGHRWKHIYEGPFPESKKIDPMELKYDKFVGLFSKGWRNKEIAHELDVDPSTVSRWRSGNTRGRDLQRLSPAGE